MTWDVEFSPAARKSKNKTGKGALSPKVKAALALLVREIEESGPYRDNWPNYGPLGKRRKGKPIPENAHHCHLQKGNPTYVACWNIEDKKSQKIKLFYVGTHENAPYN